MKLLSLKFAWGASALLAALVVSAPLVADEPPIDNRGSTAARLLLDPANKSSTTSARILLSGVQDQSDMVLSVTANTDLIGAALAQVDDVLRSHLGLDEGKGLLVTSVADAGPAAKAGIQKFDVLVSVGGQEIAGLDAFRKALEASPDKPIELSFIRAGKTQTAQVAPRAATPHWTSEVDVAFPVDGKYWLGVGLATADDTLRSQMSLPAGEGLVVTNVESDSPAAKAGVLVNDVLLNLDGKPLTTTEALTEQLQALADKSVSLELLRRGKPAMLTVAAEKRGLSDWTIEDLSYRVVYTPNLSAFWNDLGQPVNNTALQTANVTAADAALAKPDVAKQIDELRAQLKQLEASLATLRNSLPSTQKPVEDAGKAESPQ